MKKIPLILLLIIVISLFASCSNPRDEQMTTMLIDEITDTYFLAEPRFPSPIQYKVFAKIDDQYCVGDYIDVYYNEKTMPKENYYELKAIKTALSSYVVNEETCDKPVIYLYPTDKTDISVSLDFNGTLTHTYPAYNDGWSVTAYPNGKLIDKDGAEYPYLFWEGKADFKFDMSKGFCVPGNETEQFLKENLSYMGLNKQELQEFIDFWVPLMKINPYNQICFQTSNYTENAELTVRPQPDSILRIFMAYKPLDKPIEIEPQELSQFNRTGFTLVEWGGGIAG